MVEELKGSSLSVASSAPKAPRNEQDIATGEAMPPAYFRLYRIWFAFGFPAFAAVVAIFWLMVAKPAI